MSLLLLARPLAGEVTSPYGWRTHPVTKVQRFHAGIDLRAAVGTPVGCAADGVVSFTGNLTDSGLTLKVMHTGSIETVYCHLSRIEVQPGTQVAKGQQIALSGATGQVTGPHLHFGVKIGGSYTDPAEALRLGIDTGTGEVNSLTVKQSAATAGALGLLLFIALIVRRRS